MVVAKLFTITSYEFCLNGVRFSYLIMKCVGFQFFLGHTVEKLIEPAALRLTDTSAKPANLSLPILS